MRLTHPAEKDCHNLYLECYLIGFYLKERQYYEEE